MTSNLLISNSKSSLSKSYPFLDTATRVNTPGKLTNQALTLEKMKSLYQTDQQIKLLHLEVEIETLLLELRTIRERNLVLQVKK